MAYPDRFLLAGVMGWQLSTKRYIPFVYWLTVVVVSVTGTLYTDILTDSQGVPLALSSSVFAGRNLSKLIRLGLIGFAVTLATYALLRVPVPAYPVAVLVGRAVSGSPHVHRPEG